MRFGRRRLILRMPFVAKISMKKGARSRSPPLSPKKWAKHRNKQIRQPGTEGSTGHAVAKGDPEADHAIHVIPGPQGDGWIACQDKQRLAQGQSKADVLHKAREKAQAQGNELCIHDDSGQIETSEDYA